MHLRQTADGYAAKTLGRCDATILRLHSRPSLEPEPSLCHARGTAGSRENPAEWGTLGA